MEPRSATKGPIDALPGLPDHEVLEELGRGGMGIVYLATNKVMGRKEVLKVVNQQMLTEPGAMDRFLQEIRSAAQLSHTNIVTAHAVLRSGESLVLAMEHIVGDNLYKIVNTRGPLAIANACYYVHQAALGLQHAFERGMVHRDIKPDNLMLARDGKKHVVKILDFGLAKATRGNEAKQHNLTGAGQMMGTPDYIAPEQILDAAKADVRADIYSLGCTLYFLLTGLPPFKDGSLYEKLQAHMSKKPTSVHKLRPEVPPELAAIVDKMMAKEVNDRFQKPSEVAQALVPFVKGVKPLAAGDGSAGSAGPTTTLGGGGKSTGEVYTLAPSTTHKTSPGGSPKKTLIETDAAGKLQPKNKPGATPASKAKLLLLLGGGLGVAFLCLPPLCLIGAWVGGVFQSKTPDGGPIVKVDEQRTPAKKIELEGPPPVQKGDDVKQPEVEMPPKFDVKEPPPKPPVTDGFVPIFNGTNLSGWRPHPTQPGYWRVVKGVLIGSGPSPSYLYTVRGDYKDFHLLAEARINNGGNSGIFFHMPFGLPKINPKGPGPTWYEAQINSTHKDPNKTGSLYANNACVARVPISPVPVGQWFTLEVITQGNHIVLKVNGVKTADYLEMFRPIAAGHIALQQLPQTFAEFRKVEIKELTNAPVTPPDKVKAPVEAAPPEELFVQLFNGKDTAGWKTPPEPKNGRVENGILTLSGKTAGYLYSERSDFKNFHLRAEARVNDGSSAGVYFRVAEIAPKRPQGYKVLLNSDDLNLNKAGSLFNGFSTDLKPVRESLVLPGKWFTVDVIALKNQTVVKIDGKPVADYIDEKQLFRSGHIVLEQADSQTTLDFKTIGIRELAPDAKMPVTGLGALPSPASEPKVADVAPKPGPGPGVPKIVMNLKGVLKTTDPAEVTDTGIMRGRFKVYNLQMEAGKTYVISLNSTVFDAYLRLQNPLGKTIAEDDDSGGVLNARITHRCTAPGAYRIIATSFDGKIGPYQLIVQENP